MKYHQLEEDLYKEICHMLSIEPSTDEETTRFLNKKLQFVHVKRAIQRTKMMIKKRTILIFGAGPSLEKIVSIIKPLYEQNKQKITIIAVDGATEALLKKGMKIDIIISDLDGDLSFIRKSYEKYHSLLVIHGHGDNFDKILQISDLLSGKNIIGSTQAKEFLKVKNYGGFSDGDRAAYFASNFQAKNIILLAFDFGELVGEYSKPNFKKSTIATERKKIKMKIAKGLLAKLPEIFPHINYRNFTPDGENINNIPKITLDEIQNILSES